VLSKLYANFRIHFRKVRHCVIARAFELAGRSAYKAEHLL